MSKDKIIISFSIPVDIKEKLVKLAEREYSTNTKWFVDKVRTEYAYWFDSKEVKINEDK